MPNFVIEISKKRGNASERREEKNQPRDAD
jgi:hypothetical protein